MRQSLGLTVMRRVLVATAFALSLPAVAWGDALKFGNEGTYPPFSVVDSSGKLTGFEPELAREMCKRMNAECELVVMDFKALIPSMLQGKLDGIVSQITPTPERADKVLFSVIMVQNLYSFVVPANSNYSFTKEGLKGVKIGMVRGGAPAKYINDTFGGAIAPVLYDNPDQVRLELLNGRIDMTFGARINWRLELLEKPDGKDWKMADETFWLGDPKTPPDERGLSWIYSAGRGALPQAVGLSRRAELCRCHCKT